MIRWTQYTKVFYMFNRKVKIFKKSYIKWKYYTLKFFLKIVPPFRILFFLNNRILNKISENYDYKINIKWQLKKFQKIFSQIRESINNDWK